MPQKQVTLVHKSLKDAEGKPRTHTCVESEARVLLQNSDRGWKPAPKSDQPEGVKPEAPSK